MILAEVAPLRDRAGGGLFQIPDPQRQVGLDACAAGGDLLLDRAAVVERRRARRSWGALARPLVLRSVAEAAGSLDHT